MKPRERKTGLRLLEADARRLSRYDWPGNVRELQNVIERAVILSHNGRLRIDLPDQSAHAPVTARDAAKEASNVVLTDDEVRAFERANIIAALKASGGKVFGSGGAAELMDMKPTTLASRIKALKIEVQGVARRRMMPAAKPPASSQASRSTRFQITHHIRLAHIHDAIVPRLQPRPALAAILHHVLGLVRADQLDRQPIDERHEIRDLPPDRRLALELAGKAPVLGQRLPQHALGVRRVSPQQPRKPAHRPLLVRHAAGAGGRQQRAQPRRVVAVQHAAARRTLRAPRRSP